MLAKLWYRFASWRWWWAVATGMFAIVVAIVTLGRVRIGRRESSERERAEQRRASVVLRSAIEAERAKGRRSRKAADAARARSTANVERSRQSGEAAKGLDPGKREQLRREIVDKLRKSKPYGGAILLAAYLGAASPAVAAVEITSAVTEDGLVMGPGWHFTDDEHEEMTGLVIELHGLRGAHAEALSEAVNLRASLDSALVAEAVCDAALSSAERVVAARDEEVEALRVWWRQPRVIAGVTLVAGFVAGVVVGVRVSR